VQSPEQWSGFQQETDWGANITEGHKDMFQKQGRGHLNSPLGFQPDPSSNVDPQPLPK
ncbi:hypothetical protein P7K49_036676, partial [Saguinus oedipus]